MPFRTNDFFDIFGVGQRRNSSGGDEGNPNETGGSFRVGGQTPIDALQDWGLGLSRVEDANAQRGEQFGMAAWNRFNQSFADQEARLTGLFETQAGDQIGAAATRGMDRLRQQIGAGGIDPSSGAGMYRAEQIASGEQAGIRQANLGIALDSARRGEAFRNAQFSNSMALSGMMNRSPSMIWHDTLTNLAEYDLTRYGIDMNFNAAQAAADAQEDAGLFSGIGSLLGGVLGGI